MVKVLLRGPGLKLKYSANSALLIALLLVLFNSGGLVAQPFTAGNLTVLRTGTGTGSLTADATPIFIIEYTTAGVATGVAVSLPSTGTNKITNSGNGAGEGMMSLSAAHDALLVAGYDAAAGTANVAGTTAAACNRELFAVTSTGSYLKVAFSTTAYSGNAIRSGVASYGNYFGAGAGDGAVLLNTSTVLATVPTSLNSVQIINGQLYFSSDVAPYAGVSALGTGIPVTSGTSATLKISPSTAGTYGFAISPDGQIMYVADEIAGIIKYSLSGSMYYLNTIVNSTTVRGMAVDFSGVNPVLYATTTEANANKIIKMTDIGGSAVASVIATAPANTAFRGITFSPACSATIAIAGPSVICAGDSTKMLVRGNPGATVSYNINGGTAVTTTIGSNGIDTLRTGALTTTSTFNLLSITTPSCAGVAVTGSVVVTVNPAPTAIGGPSNVCNGATITLTSGTGGVWSSSNVVFGTVGTASGIVTGVSPGVTEILYTLPMGCAARKNVTVNPIPAGISGASSMCAGLTELFSDATPGGRWSVSNVAIGTIDTVTGALTGLAAGVITVSYTMPTSGCYAVVGFTVNASPVPITGATDVCVGATTTMVDTTTGGVWSSGSPTLATIGSATGIVTGISSGSVLLTYTLAGGCATYGSITVQSLPDTIAGNRQLCMGTATSMTDAAPGGTWSSSDTTIVGIVSGSGVVNCYSVGVATLSYTLPTGCFVSAPVTVNPTVSMITGDTAVCVGDTTTLLDSSAGGRWSSSAATIATVGSLSGLVSGIAAGTMTVTYTLANGCRATKPMSVNLPPVAGIITSNTSVCQAASVVLIDTTVGGVWSTTSANATVSTGGVVSGISGGTAAISYTVTNICSSVSATFNITIKPRPDSGFIIGPNALCVGSVVSYNETVTGGVWGIKNPNAGMASGAVSGLVVGKDTITYAVTNTCGTSMATKSIDVLTVPVVGALSGQDTVCRNTSITLANTTPGGVWSNTTGQASVTGGVVTGLNVGVDTIHYVVTNICGTHATYKRIRIVTLPYGGYITGPDDLCERHTAMLMENVPGGIWSASNGSATISAGLATGIHAGTDTISYSVSSACGTVIATHVMNILPMPDAGVITGPDAMCKLSKDSLKETVAGGVWKSHNTAFSIAYGGVVTAKTVGMDTAFYVVRNGCGYDSARHLITVSNNPVNPILKRKYNVLELDTVYASYQWIQQGVKVAGAKNSTFTIPRPGIYAVEVNSSTGCPGIASIEVRDLDCDPWDMKFYPNPTKDVIHVDWCSDVNVKVTDGSGANTRQFRDTQVIDLSGLPPGIYMLMFVYDDGRIYKTAKVTKMP